MGVAYSVAFAIHFQKMALSSITNNLGFIAEVPSQFCSYERIAHDDKNQANDENVIIVSHHAI
jgi:hypothetical protein